MKRVLLLAAAVVGVVAYREWKKQEETRDVWSSTTDEVR
ncbi:DLW-39 family protein [Nesterenkonia alba]|nr:DLW-39 family protein [Nesterenkonia alba]